MGTPGSQLISNGTTIFRNTTTRIIPSAGSLNNDTDTLFGYNVTSSQDIIFISMNITNSSGFQLLFVSNPGAGFISGIISSVNSSNLIGWFMLQTADEIFS